MGPPDEYRDRWERRDYYPAIKRILPLIGQCDRDCVPNYLARHIGVWHEGLGRSYNFVAFKGSSASDFSIEIKIDDDPREAAALERRGWIVEQWDRVEGYRIHLPSRFADDALEHLRGLIVRAFKEWGARQPASLRARLASLAALDNDLRPPQRRLNK